MTSTTPAPHPGAIIRERLSREKMTLIQGAKATGFSKAGFENVIYGRTGVTARMAIRLAELFDGGPSAQDWLKAQAAYDLEQEAGK